MDPDSTVQPAPGANRSPTILVVATESASKSNECTSAPSRRAARENRPLPQPMSRKDLPVRLLHRSAWTSELVAVAMRSLSTRRANEFQLAPNAKRSPALISVLLSSTDLLLVGQ